MFIFALVKPYFIGLYFVVSFTSFASEFSNKISDQARCTLADRGTLCVFPKYLCKMAQPRKGSAVVQPYSSFCSSLQTFGERKLGQAESNGFPGNSNLPDLVQQSHSPGEGPGRLSSGLDLDSVAEVGDRQALQSHPVLQPSNF